MQSIGHIIGIIFNENLKIAVLCSVNLYLMLFLLSNYFVPIKDLHYFIQWFTNLSTVKLLYECILILFYGFDRCSSSELSSAMIVFSLEDNNFYTNTKILIFQLLLFRSLALIALIIKVNPLFNTKNVNELEYNSLKQPKTLIPKSNYNNIYNL